MNIQFKTGIPADDWELTEATDVPQEGELVARHGKFLDPADVRKGYRVKSRIWRYIPTGSSTKVLVEVELVATAKKGKG